MHFNTQRFKQIGNAVLVAIAGIPEKVVTAGWTLDLRREIEILAASKPGEQTTEDVRPLLDRFLSALETGDCRAAMPDTDGQWTVEPWVKQGILLCFRFGETVDFSINQHFQFRDKDILPPQDLKARENPPRVVPGGTTVRRGCYLGKQVVIVPPAYVNVGSFVDDGTMIDSHTLVGSCAQVGKRVHVSAGVQLGGVLEPVGAMPVIVEDDAFVGAQCGIFEGTIVRREAILGAGVILTRSTRVYDLAREAVYSASKDKPLEIPERAVVIPGARQASGDFARQNNLSLQTPIIVRYREAGESSTLVLESIVRT